MAGENKGAMELLCQRQLPLPCKAQLRRAAQRFLSSPSSPALLTAEHQRSKESWRQGCTTATSGGGSSVPYPACFGLLVLVGKGKGCLLGERSNSSTHKPSTSLKAEEQRKAGGRCQGKREQGKAGKASMTTQKCLGEVFVPHFLTDGRLEPALLACEVSA